MVRDIDLRLSITLRPQIDGHTFLYILFFSPVLHVVLPRISTSRTKRSRTSVHYLLYSLLNEKILHKSLNKI